MLTKKQIEKEPDGYIRNLLYKRLELTGGISMIFFHFFFFALALILCLFLTLFLPRIPKEVQTGQYIFSEYETIDMLVYKSNRTERDYFVASDGTRLAFPPSYGEGSFDLVKGKTYEISYYTTFMFTEIYTLSDGENMLISETDYAQMCKNVTKGMCKVFITIFVISFFLDCLFTFILYNHHGRRRRQEIKEIDHKIAKRREKLKYENRE